MKNEMPKIPNSNHKLLKKGTKLVLSAATFGVVAAGSFQGVNYVVDNYNKQNTTVQSTNVLKTSSSTTSNVSAVAQNCMPSIVSITNVSVSDVQNYFSMYGNNSRSNPFTQQENTSVGSGVIINKKNGEIDILTNYHVIENAKTLTCTLADNTNVVATVKGVDENLSDYKLLEAARLLQDFVDELSNWYVRRSRERFWVTDMTEDKITAYMTLYTALITIAKTAAPMIPFMTEEIYQNLVRSVDANAPESIHLCDFPVVDETAIDRDLEADMDEVLQVVTLGRAARNAANIKNRQPVANIYVKAGHEVGELYQNIIKEELNIKEIHFVEDTSQFTSYTFKPQLKTLGQRYGKKVNEIRTLLAEIDGSKAKKQLDETGVLSLTLSDGEVANLAVEDLLIESGQTEGYMPLEDRGIVVVLDTKLTPELVEEGFVREIISKIQSMRKEADFNVTDHIVLYEEGNDKLKEIIERNAAVIKNDTLTDEFVFGTTEGFAQEFNVNGEKVKLGVKVK